MRGTSLLTTLLWVALVATLGMVLGALTIQHLGAMSLQERRQEAQRLARSAVARAIEQLMADPTFGSTNPWGGMLSPTLAGVAPGATGYLTFDSSLAQAQGVPCSLNNLAGSNTLSGYGGNVPKASALLVGEGRSGGVIKRTRVLLAVPPFPYSMATGGTVKASGGVTAGSLSAVPNGPVPAGSPLGPGSLLSNDPSGQAMFLGAGTNVTGDVRSAGTITLDPQAPAGTINVGGRLWSNAGTVKIPQIPAATYDPQALGVSFKALNQANMNGNPLVLGGVSRRTGALSVSGGLQLDGGLLFVDGDINIQGGLTGKGILAASGNINVQGQADLISGNGVAVVSGNNLTLGGMGSLGSYFQGLVYAQGSLVADQVSVVGSMIAAGTSPNQVSLHDTRVLQVPVQIQANLGDFSLTYAQPIPNPSPGGPTTRPGTVSISVLGPGQLHVASVLQPPPSPYVGFGVTTVFNTTTDLLMTNVTQNLDNLYLAQAVKQEVLQKVSAWLGPSSGTVGVTTVDPSSFLSLAERIRIVMWRDEE